jgi:hypothetical protein
MIFQKSTHSLLKLDNMFCLSFDSSNVLTISLLKNACLEDVSSGIQDVINDSSLQIDKKIKRSDSTSWKTKDRLWNSKLDSRGVLLFVGLVEHLSKTLYYIGSIHASTDECCAESLFFSETLGKPPKVRYLSCLAFPDDNQIELFHFGENEIDVVRAAVVQHWPRGIRKDSPSDGKTSLLPPEAHKQFKLNGRPWGRVTDLEAVQARTMIAQILCSIVKCGYTIFDAHDICVNARKKSIVLFERCPQGEQKDQENIEIYGCSLFSSSKVLILGTENGKRYSEFLNIARKCFEAYWKIYSETPLETGCVMDCGKFEPIWRQTGYSQRNFQIHAIFCKMFLEMEKNGFHFVCNMYSTDRTREHGSDDDEVPEDLGTLFFSTNPGIKGDGWMIKP